MTAALKHLKTEVLSFDPSIFNRFLGDLLMKLRFFLLVTAIICLSSSLFAQHNDVEFGYDDTNNPSGFVLSPLGFDIVTREGFILVESGMEELDPFSPGDFAADQPGFATHSAQGLIVNPGDAIMINALDASLHSNFGVGYVNYYNPTTDALEATGRIAFEDNTNSTPDLVLNGDSIESGVNPQFIGLADGNGNIHDHITWDLLDDASAPQGAYGLLVQLQSDFSPLDGGIELSSDPFWLVFNHGMSDTDFERFALLKFGAIPEPGSAMLIGFATCILASCRRRRR